MNIWDAIIKFSWAALIVLSVVGVVLIFTPKCRTLRELQRKKQALEEGNRRTEAVILDLKTRQELFLSDPAFVERTARETGMVKSNEAIVKIVREQPAAEPVQQR